MYSKANHFYRMNYRVYGVRWGKIYATIKTCNDAVGAFRSYFPDIKVKSWKVEGQTTIINNDPTMDVTEYLP